MQVSAALPELSTTAALRRAGETAKSLERAVRAGSVLRIHRGAYLATEQWAEQGQRNRHLLLMAGTQQAARARIVFSHESAAAVLGVPIIGCWPDKPHATAALDSGRRSTAALTWHTAALDGEIVDTGRFLVTSPLRTLIDLLASRSFLSGVVSAEHVLHRYPLYAVTKDQLIAEIEARRPFRHVNRAKAVADLATHLSESPGESLSRVRFSEGGYRQPEQQKRFLGLDGREYFPDFYFPDADAIGESDGYGKYENPEYLHDRTPAEALRDEKMREDALRPLVRAFVRWDWNDAWSAQPLYRKLRGAGIRSVRLG